MEMPQCTQFLVIWMTKHRTECLWIKVPVDESHRHDQAPPIALSATESMHCIQAWSSTIDCDKAKWCSRYYSNVANCVLVVVIMVVVYPYDATVYPSINIQLRSTEVNELTMQYKPISSEPSICNTIWRSLTLWWCSYHRTTPDWPNGKPLHRANSRYLCGAHGVQGKYIAPMHGECMLRMGLELGSCELMTMFTLLQ